PARDTFRGTFDLRRDLVLVPEEARAQRALGSPSGKAFGETSHCRAYARRGSASPTPSDRSAQRAPLPRLWRALSPRERFLWKRRRSTRSGELTQNPALVCAERGLGRK